MHSCTTRWRGCRPTVVIVIIGRLFKIEDVSQCLGAFPRCAVSATNTDDDSDDMVCQTKHGKLGTRDTVQEQQQRKNKSAEEEL